VFVTAARKLLILLSGSVKDPKVLAAKDPPTFTDSDVAVGGVTAAPPLAAAMLTAWTAVAKMLFEVSRASSSTTNELPSADPEKL
jgi:hypothetical protein